MTGLEKYKELFPEGFPFGLFIEMDYEYPNALHYENSDVVYRIATFGLIDRSFFLPSILEDKNRERYAQTRTEPIGLADWSVSCYTKKKDAIRLLNCLKRHHPPALLTAGSISEGTGLWAHSRDRDKNKKDSHVDWWMYDGQCPIDDFEVDNARY